MPSRSSAAVQLETMDMTGQDTVGVGLHSLLLRDQTPSDYIAPPLGPKGENFDISVSLFIVKSVWSKK